MKPKTKTEYLSPQSDVIPVGTASVICESFTLQNLSEEENLFEWE